MEAIPAQGRQLGQPMQQGSKGVRKCSTAPSVSVGASVRRSFHTAATSFASIASLSTGSPLKLPTRRKGQGPSKSLSMYSADKFGKWKRKNKDKEETVKLGRWGMPSPAVNRSEQVNWGRGLKPLGGEDSMKKRRQRSEGDEWASGWPFKKGSQQEREKPRIRKEDVDEMRGAWSKEAAGGGRGKGEKEGEKMNDSGLKGNGGERDERGEGSGVIGPETQSGDCRKEKVVLQ
jgi:hypothetical protein